MLRLKWNEEADTVLIHSHDDVGGYRFLAFTDAQLMHFPLEVKKKVLLETKATPIGFQFTEQGENVTTNE